MLQETIVQLSVSSQRQFDSLERCLMSRIVSHTKDRAPIVHRSETEICFRVDEVAPCQERLPLTNARQQLEKKLGRSLEALTHDEASNIVLEEQGIEHSLVRAVYLAFSQHRSLVLPPDTMWITLAQGFAHHINNHADALRPRMVTHTGEVTLKVFTKTRI